MLPRRCEVGEIIRGGEETRVRGSEGNERAGGGEVERLEEEHEAGIKTF